MNMRKRTRGFGRRKAKGTMRCVLAVGSVLLFLLGVNQVSFAAGAEIWDNGIPGWTSIFGDGDPIDAAAGVAFTPQLAVDSNDRVYVAYSQGPAGEIYLSRYDGTAVRIWDNNASGWTINFGDGDPIDVETGALTVSLNPQLAIDSNDRVYITYSQLIGQNHIFLSRYDGTDVKIWSNAPRRWETDFSQGDPIDNGTTNSTIDPQLAIDSNDNVFVTYSQNDGAIQPYQRIYLSRYDGSDVRIWSTAGWIQTPGNGDPIDTGTANNAGTDPQLAVDSNDNVYVTFVQAMFPAINHIYLSRYNATTTSVEIWDTGTPSWKTTLNDGDPIDTNPANTNPAIDATSPQLAIDSTDSVYIAFKQDDGILGDRVYLSRYNATVPIVEIWDIAGWTTTFSAGDPIDAGTGAVTGHQLAIDSTGKVYIVFAQNNSIYLSRYNGMIVQIWDNTAPGWKSNFNEGRPIDTGLGTAENPQLSIDSNDNVYVTYAQVVGGVKHIYLSRYNKMDVKIWGTTGWTTTFGDGKPIDTGTANDAQGPQLVSDSNDRAYVTFGQGAPAHIYLSRYMDASSPIILPPGGSGGGCFISTSMDGSLFAP